MDHAALHKSGSENTESGTSREKIIKGRPVAPGIGYGRPCFFREKTPETPAAEIQARDAQHDMISDAFTQLSQQLRYLAESAGTSFNHNIAEIFHAHRMIIENEELQQNILNTFMQGKLSAEDTIEKCFDDYFDYFSGLNDEYLSARSHDFAELKQLLLNLLNHTDTSMHCRDYHDCQVGACVLKNDHILITAELTAGTALRIREPTRGIIAGKCGANSHAALIARSLNIPVVGGIENLTEIISCEDDVLINGNNGEVITRPGLATLARYRHQINKSHRSYDMVEPIPQFRVLADIDRCTEVEIALQVQADGIGIYRTEFEMLCRGHLLSEAEQLEAYNHVLTCMAGKPVYIRLYDLGSDKSAPWLEISKEDNPALGCRGARYLLQRPELLREQARAIAHASRIFPVHVIYPMIASPEQFAQLKGIFMEAITGINGTQLNHGIMFEVPSACMEAGELYQVIDFGRIGSNDLVQYLFACDRGGNDFSYEELSDSPAMWRTITALSGIARACGKPLELCGAMAANPAIIPMLIDLGITTISTRPEYVAAARRAARACFDTKPETPDN
jgi:phosphotransferase system enzyme I (PtsI)